MSCGNGEAFATTAVVRAFTTLLLTLTALLAAPVALAVDSGDIVIVSAKGEVHITVKGAARDVRAGGVLELPATVSTGPDGAVEIRQGATTLSVGPETLLEFPALEKRGAPIDRIVQPRGNAFYNIGKREGRKMRVETPYMVGAVKGTQFNVAVQDGSATISLFEGLLDVRFNDDSGAIELKAGEIASRKRGDESIRVMKMDGVEAAPTGARTPASTSSNTVTSGPSAMPVDSRGESLLGDSNLAVDTPANTDVRVSGTADANVNAGPVAVDVDTNVNVDAGPVVTDAAVATVDLDLDVDLGLDDDGNNGHGNDSDGSDSSNPGRSSDNNDELSRHPHKK